MRRVQSAGGVQREALSGNIVTQKKNYGKAAGICSVA